jgi:8-oxo-dGTP pyrophosphatase MutT (NUDIX family)
MRLVAPPDLSPELATEIDRRWEEEVARSGGRLFDGSVVGLTGVSPHELTLCRADYRTILATRRDPAIRAALGMMPVGVTSALFCSEGLVVGQRSDWLAMSPGQWELMPGGALEYPAPDPHQQIRQEFQEELGLPADDLCRVEIKGLVTFPEDGIANVVYHLETKRTAADILKAFAESGSGEHSQIRVISPNTLDSLLNLATPHGRITRFYALAAGIVLPAATPHPAA